MSNGASMCFRLAHDIPQIISGIAPVTGGMSRELVNQSIPDTPVSTLIINNVDDPVTIFNGKSITIDGQSVEVMIPVLESLQYWANTNQCSNNVIQESFSDVASTDNTRAYKTSYETCKNNTKATLIHIDGAGHTWPGGWQYMPIILVGRTCQDIIASELIWDFFNLSN